MAAASSPSSISDRSMDRVVPFVEGAEMDESLRAVVRELCDWKDATDEQLVIKKIGGGITNLLYRVAYGDRVRQEEWVGVRMSSPSLTFLLHLSAAACCSRADLWRENGDSH
jgi:hypothetical protein